MLILYRRRYRPWQGVVWGVAALVTCAGVTFGLTWLLALAIALWPDRLVFRARR